MSNVHRQQCLDVCESAHVSSVYSPAMYLLVHMSVYIIGLLCILDQCPVSQLDHTHGHLNIDTGLSDFGENVHESD